MLLKTSSGIIYQDIVLIDELHEENGLFVYAQWDYIDQHLEIFTQSWKQGCTTDQDYVDELIYVITHEVLHSEIEFAIAGEDYGLKGDNDEYVYNEHYPYLNGMDPEYVKRMR